MPLTQMRGAPTEPATSPQTYRMNFPQGTGCRTAAAKHAAPRPSACISAELKHGARGEAATEAGWTPHRHKGLGQNAGWCEDATMSILSFPTSPGHQQGGRAAQRGWHQALVPALPQLSCLTWGESPHLCHAVKRQLPISPGTARVYSLTSPRHSGPHVMDAAAVDVNTTISR